MKIGFTGAQKGMTDLQKHTVGVLLFQHGKVLNDKVEAEFHHGDCVGADAEAHDIAIEHGIDVVIHPPISDKQRAFCKDAKLVHPEKKYLDRNHDIVDDCNFLIGAPFGEKEVLRSGTWATIRYAMKKRGYGGVYLVYPSGEYDLFGK